MLSGRIGVCELKDPMDMQALRYASYISKWG